MKKTMISQPMGGLTYDIIEATRRNAIRRLNTIGYEVVDTFLSNDLNTISHLEEVGITHRSLRVLGKSLEKMSLCDAVYFTRGWENARGCRIQHAVAEEYGLERIYEE